jgi:uncharacterized membrane protein YdjX (TVP38/TMEM64 family)
LPGGAQGSARAFRLALCHPCRRREDAPEPRVGVGGTLAPRARAASPDDDAAPDRGQIVTRERPPARGPSPLLSRLARVVAGAVGLALAQRVGVFAQLREPARLATSLVDLGVWGYVAFVFAYALLQPFGVPGTVFIVAAPLIWPWPVAFALSMTGTMAASVVGFSFARFLARDWLAPRIPERFRKYDDALARRAFATVFVLRLVFWMPPLLHAFFGVSRVRAWTHFWGSLAGYVIPLLLVSFFGPRLFDALKRIPPHAWVGVGIGVVTLAAGALVWRRRRARGR